MNPSAIFSSHTYRNSNWVLAVLLGLVTVLVGGMAAVLDPRITLVLFLPVIPVIAIFYNYRIGVIFLALLLPFSNSQFLPKFPGFNIVGYLSLATFLAFGLQHLGVTNRFIRLPRWLLLFILPVGFATVMGVSHVNEVPNYMVVTEAFAPTTASRYIKDLFIYPMLTVLWAWMLAHAVSASPRPQRYVWLLTIASVLPAVAVLAAVAVLGVSGIGVSELAESPTAATRGLLSISGFHANEAGLLLATGFGPLLFMTAATKLLRERVLLLAMLGLISLALVLTFTRGAYVAAGIAVFAFLVQGRGGTSMKLLVLITILLVVAAFGNEVFTRLMDGWTGIASSDARAAAVTASRTAIWRALWPDVLAHPVLGGGLRSTAWSSAAKSMIIPTHPHNLYLEIFKDMGMLGFVLLLVFFRRFATLLKGAADRSQSKPMVSAYLKGAYASFIGYLVSGFANWHYTPVPENTFLWAGFGMAMACYAISATDLPSPTATLYLRQGRLTSEDQRRLNQPST